MCNKVSKFVRAYNFRGRVILPVVYACIRDAQFQMLNELLARDE